jgi:myo-inositol-1(or 4)-monophosphatase
LINVLQSAEDSLAAERAAEKAVEDAKPKRTRITAAAKAEEVRQQGKDDAPF